MIYFDNAATGGFKAHAAVSAAENVIKFLSANPGRSGHRLATTGAKIVTECREVLAKNFGADASRVVFTKNCTEALNTALFGAIKGGNVIATDNEHNSVLRPLYRMRDMGTISLEIVPAEKLTDFLQTKRRGEIAAVVTTAVSNVTGRIAPVKKIGALSKELGALYVVDGAQGGGHIPLSLAQQNISCLALAGHKGLGGIMGSGALIIGDGVEVEPLTFGGTGTDTFLQSMPRQLPERLEAGTLNLPAVASLLEGARYAFKNFDNFAKALVLYTERLINGLKEIPAVKLYSAPNPAGIVSFKIDGVTSETAADILNDEYDVAVRGGFHCAPKTHESLGTEKEGLVRASLAVQNSASEIDYFVKAVKRIASKSF